MTWWGWLLCVYGAIGVTVAYASRGMVADDVRRTGITSGWQLYALGLLNVALFWPVVLLASLPRRGRHRR